MKWVPVFLLMEVAFAGQVILIRRSDHPLQYSTVFYSYVYESMWAFAEVAVTDPNLQSRRMQVPDTVCGKMW